MNVLLSGNCVVHHMFGNIDTVNKSYVDAFVTAHLEVLGKMFQIDMETLLEGKGTIGLTSDILSFIKNKVAEAAQGGSKECLQFILGTEVGMVTSIVTCPFMKMNSMLCKISSIWLSMVKS